jgi:phasin family protein
MATGRVILTQLKEMFMTQPQRKQKQPAHFFEPISPTDNLEALDTLPSVRHPAFKNLTETVAESVEAITKRQADIIQSGTESAMQFCQDVCSFSESPDMHLAKHIEFGRIAFENALANVDEMGRLVAKSNVEIMGAITDCCTSAFIKAFTSARIKSDSSRTELKQESA